MKDKNLEALIRLRTAEELMRRARISVDAAILALDSDSRRTSRCVELANKLGDDIAHCHRCAFYVEGDVA